jgi:hypothetical protein
VLWAVRLRPTSVENGNFDLANLVNAYLQGTHRVCVIDEREPELSSGRGPFETMKEYTQFQDWAMKFGFVVEGGPENPHVRYKDDSL